MESYLGKIRISSGQLLVTDPCYIPESLDPGGLTHVVEFPNGDHDVHVDIENTGGWGLRVMKLRIEARGDGFGRYSGGISPRHIGEAAVDSGQMSLMDASLVSGFERDSIAVIGNPNFHEEWDSKVLSDFIAGKLSYHAACFPTIHLGPGAGLVGEKLTDPCVGLTRQMAVCSSGYGDGRYPVRVLEVGDEVVGLEVDFSDQDDDTDDDHL